MVTEKPLVSVICLCFNQRDWIEEAIHSVINQSYPHIQLIIADDASTDGSSGVIEKLKTEFPQIRVLLFGRNQGNCKAFNTALREAQGEYVVDFAADDVMKASRIEKQVALFNQLDDSYGVIFTDAHYIDSGGKFIREHYEYLRKKKLLGSVPEGDVYRDVLSRYFIASPTMMVRRTVFDRLDGYDETLGYEDFDFWLRSSRYFKFAFLNESLTLIRRTGNSMSSGWYKRGDKQLYSTYLVCRKAIDLNRDEDDRNALITRVRYEMRQSILSDNHYEAVLFYQLLRDLRAISSADKLLNVINRSGIPLRGLRSFYQSVRFKEPLSLLKSES
jgi:glycosyltransferase involved in cell wall biosynthesis